MYHPSLPSRILGAAFWKNSDGHGFFWGRDSGQDVVGDGSRGTVGTSGARVLGSVVGSWSLCVGWAPPTIVTRSDTSPSVVAPELLVSYRLPWISRFSWENKCRGGCSFLLSGGAGANLTSKSADFDSGFSFQIGSVLFTPTVHYGRENRLSNGVAVGQQLGASPPNPLPTNYQWVKKFGIAVTYALPIP